MNGASQAKSNNSNVAGQTILNFIIEEITKIIAASQTLSVFDFNYLLNYS